MQEAKPKRAMNQGVLAVVKFLYSILVLSEFFKAFSLDWSDEALFRISSMSQANTVPSVPAENRIFFLWT